MSETYLKPSELSAQGGQQPVLGAQLRSNAVAFGLYAKPAEHCQVQLYDRHCAPGRIAELRAHGDGYFSAEVVGVAAGARYQFVVDGRTLPDPYARFLPDGVHAPAQIVESNYPWARSHALRRPLSEQVLYELHIGTFTPEGTYEAARKKLPYLAALGVTTLELMPLSSFAGGRGWGYDGVMHYAPFAPYGSPDELRRFIDEAHGRGLCMLLDVVYNHFGPSGNYLGAYCPEYFTHEFENAWGQAPCFRHPVMRRYVLENALYWLESFRFDGLRLDAIHAVFDPSPRHILREITDTIRQRVPSALVFAEDERNDPGCITELGCDGVWADDFHHHVRVTLTGEREGYYAGYQPGPAELARVIQRGWSYEGQTYPPSGKPRGKSAAELDVERFVYCIQNHDQIGNRALGTRLCHDVDLDAYCVASALLLFLPMTPLIFMGQEWAASSPFLFFTDHDEELGALVTAGRRREFASFSAFADAERRSKIPDPQSKDTFERSKIDWQQSKLEPHARVQALYRELLALRRDPAFKLTGGRSGLSAQASGEVLSVQRQASGSPSRYVLLANFGHTPAGTAGLPWVTPSCRKVLSTQPTTVEVVPPNSALIVAQ